MLGIHRQRRRRRTAFKKIILSVISTILVSAVALVAYAYFSTRVYVYTEEGRELYRMGMKLNQLFDRVNSDPLLTQIGENYSLGIVCRNSSVTSGVTAPDENGIRYYTYDPNADWGSANNPYLINNLRHLQNLSVLQNEGYFDFITNEYAVGDTDGEQHMPYFLVCNPNGTVTQVDGSEMHKAYEPIGNNEHPFIGYIGGAFRGGLATIDGKTCNQSVLSNIQIQPDTDFIDVGLFGCIGYLGDDTDYTQVAVSSAEEFASGKYYTLENNEYIPANAYNPNATYYINGYKGATATVRDLLLYDIQIEVEDTSFLDTVVDTTGHLFRFTDDPNESAIPHEDHHIGILAGHAEYSTIEYISVYYSSEEKVALKVDHDASNYLSNSGIIGFVHNMNCTQENGFVRKDGTTNEDMSVSAGGAGSGGGLLSGEGRGYVTAAEIFNAYDDSGQVVKYTITVPGVEEDTVNTYNSLLVIASGAFGGNNSYSLEDGSRVTISNGRASITNSYTQYIRPAENVSSWDDFVVRYGTDGDYTYYHRNQATIDNNTVTPTGIYLRFAANRGAGNHYTPLCTQYIRDRILWGTQLTDRYYFYDGVFTFSVSSASDTIDETWDGKESDDTSYADKFSVGEDDPDQWVSNVTEGNQAVVSYLKPITTKQELSEAVRDNRQFVILKKTENGNALVSLSETPNIGSWQDGDDICSINAKTIQTLDENSSLSLKNAFANGTLDLNNISRLGNSFSGTDRNGTRITNGIQLSEAWDDYYLLYFGSELVNNADLSEVESNYLISGIDTGNDATNYVMADGIFTTQAVGINNQNRLFEDRDETSDFNGFFYTTVEHSYTNSGNQRSATETFTFTYYYMQPDGTSIPTGKTSTVSRRRNWLLIYYWGQFNDNQIPLTKASVSNGEQLYSCSIGNTSYTAPLIYKFGDDYFTGYSINETDSYSPPSSTIDGNGSAIVNGGTYSAGIINTYTYSTYIIQTGSQYKLYTVNGNTRTETDLSIVNPTTAYDPDGRLLYAYHGINGETGTAVMAKYEVSGVFNFYHGTGNSRRYLRIERRKGWLTNYMYTLWCATDSEHDGLSSWTVTYNTSKDGYVTFNDDGSCNIRYRYGQDRYLNYNGSVFNGTSNASADGATLYLYSYEGSQKASYGRITFDPAGNTGTTYSADSFVLWPNQVYNENNSSTNTYKPRATGHTTDPTYSIKKLGDSGDLTSAKGWKDAHGNALAFSNLRKAFTLGEGTADVDLLTIWNGNLSTSNDSYVRAPIGSDGKESYIPTGCVAFRINKSSEIGEKIRVIVAVPQTDAYYNESGNPLDYDNDYYFCLWNVPEAGTSTRTRISIANAIQGFELPRSNSYTPGSSPANEIRRDINNNPVVSSYIKITDGNDIKRCYLNGDEVLVAYEFTVYDEGVYILGSTHACQIVYFSADATASEGNDGETSYKMGTIDYVYDNGSKVLTVKDIDTRDRTAAGYEKDYSQYYYNSYAILYTNNFSAPDTNDTDTTTYDGNEYPNINDFTIHLRRYLKNGKPNIDWSTEDSDGKYIVFAGYNVKSDTIDKVPS